MGVETGITDLRSEFERVGICPISVVVFPRKNWPHIKIPPPNPSVPLSSRCPSPCLQIQRNNHRHHLDTIQFQYSSSRICDIAIDLCLEIQKSLWTEIQNATSAFQYKIWHSFHCRKGNAMVITPPSLPQVILLDWVFEWMLMIGFNHQ